MIALEGLAARRAPLTLSNVSLAWGPGAHALVGSSADGGSLLLALIAGAARPRSGRVRVLGGAPSDPAVRRQMAFIPLEPTLPEALRVDEVLRLAAVVRREQASDATDRLSVLGIEALAPRLSRTLSREEARAVALAEAVTSSRVRILLLDEPLVALDPRAGARISDVLRARSRDGCTVLVATASVRDAMELAADYVMLRAGAVVGRASSLDGLVGFSQNGVRLRIVVDDPPALLAALAREESVEALGRYEGALVARGRDALSLARAVGRAVVAAGVDVTEMRLDAPLLDDVRTPSFTMAMAAGDREARERTQAISVPLPSPRTSSPAGADGP